MIALLLWTPREYVGLSSSSTGEALYEYFNQRSFAVLPTARLCQGVLLLPPDHADYLRGHRRQALRTNLRKAATAGIWCEVVSDPRRAADDISHVLGRQWGWLPEAELQDRLNKITASVAASEVTLTIARDIRGRPLAMAAAVIDDGVCLIKHAVASNHEARWALHDHLVRVLIARGVRYLLATGGGTFGALGFVASVQHYQHLLGYELRHVIPVSARRASRRRRLIAAGVVVAGTVALAVPSTALSAPFTLGASDRGTHIQPSWTHDAFEPGCSAPKRRCGRIAAPRTYSLARP